MLVFEFELSDLANTRFAISPMHELFASMRLLRDPDRAALHLPWVHHALPIARELDLELALALSPPRGYMPDFLTPPPRSPVASFEEELELLRGMSAAQVRTEVGRLLDGGPPPDEIRLLLERPRPVLKRLTDNLERFWALAIEPYWPRMRALLDADLLYRSQRLTDGGPARLFADLHPNVRWSGDRLEVEKRYDVTVPLRELGLLLVPSVFSWDRPCMIIDLPWQPTLVYPARGIGLLWEPQPDEPSDGLSGLVGRTRATLLEALDAPASTTQLAARLDVTPGAVSQHLGALRNAGLVAGERNGRSVLYARTELADRLLEGAGSVA